MFFFKKWSIAKENAAKAAAISKSQAVIEFGLDGTVITANENFLNTFGYTLRGDSRQAPQHVRGDRANGPAPHTATSGPSSIGASLNRPSTNVSASTARRSGFRLPIFQCWIRRETRQKLSCSRPISPRKRSKPWKTRIRFPPSNARRRVVAFNLDGTIITANKNFLNAMGYALGEVQGKHDGMFVEPRSGRVLPIANSGPSSIAASLNRLNTGALVKAGKKSGFWRPITRSRMRTASRSRLSRSRLTSPNRN